MSELGSTVISYQLHLAQVMRHSKDFNVKHLQALLQGQGLFLCFVNI